MPGSTDISATYMLCKKKLGGRWRKVACCCVVGKNAKNVTDNPKKGLVLYHTLSNMKFAESRYYTDNTVEKVRCNLNLITKINSWVSDKDYTKSLIGQIKSNSFEVTTVSRRSRSMYPVAHGLIIRQANGTKIDVQVVLEAKALLISLVFAGVLLLALTKITNEYLSLYILAIIFSTVVELVFVMFDIKRLLKLIEKALNEK